MELLFILLFAYVRKLRSEKLRRVAEAASSKAKEVIPLEAVADKAKQVMPTLMK